MCLFSFHEPMGNNGTVSNMIELHVSRPADEYCMLDEYWLIADCLWLIAGNAMVILMMTMMKRMMMEMATAMIMMFI